MTIEVTRESEVPVVHRRIRRNRKLGHPSLVRSKPRRAALPQRQKWRGEVTVESDRLYGRSLYLHDTDPIDHLWRDLAEGSPE